MSSFLQSKTAVSCTLTSRFYCHFIGLPRLKQPIPLFLSYQTATQPAPWPAAHRISHSRSRFDLPHFPQPFVYPSLAGISQPTPTAHTPHLLDIPLSQCILITPTPRHPFYFFYCYLFDYLFNPTPHPIPFLNIPLSQPF